MSSPYRCTYRRPADPAGRRHFCSAWHFELVTSYRAERERQELALEEITLGYPADRELYLARGGRRPVTFREWLIAHAGGAER